MTRWLFSATIGVEAESENEAWVKARALCIRADELDRLGDVQLDDGTRPYESDEEP